MTESTTKDALTQYTTGELAKRCGVSVRTVQYYDNRGVLVPSEVSSGGRRLYDEQDVRRLSVITFLRGLGFSISQITELLTDDQSAAYIDSLIVAQRLQLSKQIELDQRRLQTLDALRRMLGRVDDADGLDVHAFSDAAYVTRRTPGLRRIHGVMLALGVVCDVVQIGLLVVALRSGNWIPFCIGLVPVVAMCAGISVYYFKSVSYLCPNCHTVFRPKFAKAFWAAHTTYSRKLTCPHCGYSGWCLEVPAAHTGTDAETGEPMVIV